MQITFKTTKTINITEIEYQLITQLFRLATSIQANKPKVIAIQFISDQYKVTW